MFAEEWPLVHDIFEFMHQHEVTHSEGASAMLLVLMIIHASHGRDKKNLLEMISGAWDGCAPMLEGIRLDERQELLQ